ncbi:MAG: 3-hydroxyacyl-CoA dehydrogenase family protein [Actinomycetota bacterium]|nr:3-hydroxyacyl-CoA dehydrogenase family protein [Actinomycetota bacterium]
MKELITSFGKLPVVLRKDVPGFVANRFLMPMLIEEARLLEEHVPSKEGIDLLVKNGLGFPIGPFELGVLIGLDEGLDVISYIHDELGEPYYTSPHILKDMVKIGRIGRKSGAGVYDYS